MSNTALSAIRNDVDYMNRLAKWNIFWMAYRGVFYNRMTKEFEEDVTLNNLKKVVSTQTWFTFGETGAVVEFDAAQKEIQKEISRVLEYNNFPAICYDMGTDAAVYGDCYIKIGFEELDESDPFLRRYGLKHGRVVLSVVDPTIIYPKVNEFNKDIVEFYVVEYENDRHQTQTELHYKDHIELYKNDSLVLEIPNPLNEFLIVHIQNLHNTKSFFGLSDFEDIFSLNKELITKMKDLSEIIDYHGSPVTLMFGVKRQDLVKSAKRVWSGLPKDARVENLSLETDLGAINTFIKNLDDKVWELADIPEIARGKSLSISNTSSAAMKMLYYPLIQKAGRKKILLTAGIKEVIWKVLSLLEIKGIIDFSEPPQYKVVYPSPFPIDELNTMTVIERRKALGMITKRQALEYLGEENIDEIIDKFGEEFPSNEKTPAAQALAPKESFYTELEDEPDKLLQSQNAQKEKAIDKIKN